MNRTRRTGALILAFVGVIGIALPLTGQERASRGIWEPVNYTEDLALTDIYFVTPDIGWVSGAAGTILHTNDGGKSWSPQLGGDPGGADEPIGMLRFVDERHGWAVQRNKLFRTTDGESWEEIGATPNAMASNGDYAFVSPTVGFALGSTTDIGYPDYVFRTLDGGHTWAPVSPCEVKATIEGLAKHFRCVPTRLHFPSPAVGYVLARECMGPQCGLPIVGKTVDGGETWTFVLGPGEIRDHTLKELFFTDERTGFIQSRQGTSDKLYATTDGGGTWRGVVATPGDWLRFADPEVGWSLDEHHLAYTASGGARWSSRAHRFPATPRALSFPRRDRAYVVGDHGMVFRYRVLDPGQTLAKGALAAPAMPPYATPLEGEAAEVLALVQSFQAAGGAAAAPAAAAGAPLAPAKLKKLDLLITALGSTVPSFLSQFANLNLLAARLRSAGDLPGRFSEVKAAIAAAKEAPDNSAAQAALAQALTAAQGLHAAAAVATGRQLPPEEASAPPASAEGPASAPENIQPAPAGEEAAGETPSDDGLAAAAARAVEEEAGKKAKEELGKSIKKKLRF